MSETSVPSTVSVLNNSRKLPARYMSWLISARNIIGPVVGRLSTTEMIVAPETRPGSTYARPLMNGLSATRTGYFQISARSFIPLARAVTTYGLRSSSSRLARIVRISPAVPAMPRTTTGTHRWRSRSANFARLHGASLYAAENSPPTSTPNQL